jgi:hypothetical protein
VLSALSIIIILYNYGFTVAYVERKQSALRLAAQETATILVVRLQPPHIRGAHFNSLLRTQETIACEVLAAMSREQLALHLAAHQTAALRALSTVSYSRRALPLPVLETAARGRLTSILHRQRALHLAVRKI